MSKKGFVILMRMRKKKNRDTRIERCSSIIIAEPYPKSDWQNVFGNTNPIHMEIGCGKGSFIMQMVEKFPDINFIALEKCPDVAVLAMEKIIDRHIPNVRFICGDANYIEDIVSPGILSRIYINFCDPWHKKKQYKRRLTYRGFLEKYKYLLEENHGEVHFKTDNKRLFEFSLNEFCALNLKLKNITLDLHNSDFEGNIMTEYETLFSEKGMPIYRCEICF